MQKQRTASMDAYTEAVLCKILLVLQNPEELTREHKNLRNWIQIELKNEKIWSSRKANLY